MNEVIKTLERQESIEETSELSKEETKLVLLELKAIMAVYEKKDSINKKSGRILK